MNKVQYFNYGDLVYYKFGKNYYTGKIVDFFKYADELRIYVQFNVGLMSFKASQFNACNNFWVIG